MSRYKRQRCRTQCERNARIVRNKKVMPGACVLGRGPPKKCAIRDGEIKSGEGRVQISMWSIMDVLIEMIAR